MNSLLQLPHEVLHSILLAGDVKTLVTLSACSKALYGFIKQNALLYKELYLRSWDFPVSGYGNNEPQWEQCLMRMGRLEQLLQSQDCSSKTKELAFVAGAVDALLRAVPTGDRHSLNMDFLRYHFASNANLGSLVCQSTMFQQALRECLSYRTTSNDNQLSAKLHCLFGVPIDEPLDRKHLRAYPFACSKVYDLRNYTPDTLWGPFRDDGSECVDWEKVEAIMVVIGYNIRLFSERTNNHFKPIWTVPFEGAAPNSYQSLQPLRLQNEPKPPVDLLDPYNITGTWMRVVCFLDYTEFYDYNFVSPDPPPGQPRPPLDTDEATRLIITKLKPTKAEAPGENDGPDLPVMHFSGTSHSTHAHWDPNANSKIRGTVRLTKEGEVRWTTFSIFQGEERWRAEGIQVGGVNSGRGVLGNWFDKDFRQQGPAGPTALWKINDDYDSEKRKCPFRSEP